MRTLVWAVAMIALAGWCSQANAQSRCPELTELRDEANQASKQARSFARMGRCETYVRSAMAWNALMHYASEHREACDISSASLTEFEKRQREMTQLRDNVCAGRPGRPFPAEIIQR